jgi:hypothetical protein
MERTKRAPAPTPGVDTPTLSSHSRLRAAPANASTTYVAMREVLLVYLSPILVDTVLSRALYSRRVSVESATRAQVAELAADVMVGLRLFVPEDRLSQLMLDLAEVLEEK